MDKEIIKNRKAIVMAVTDFGKIGPMTFQQLLMRLGAPEDFLHATIEDLADIPRLKDSQTVLVMESLEKIASAAQIKINVTVSAIAMGSRNKNTAKLNSRIFISYGT